jgi:hypothetical protein
MGSNASEIFGDALSRGPAILFLGQEVLRFQTGIDPLLAELSREIGKKQFQDYRELIKQAVAVSTPNFAWLASQCAKVGPPLWLDHIAEFPWSAVYSSAIDNAWYSAFKESWRNIHQHFHPRPDQYSRNQQRLTCNYLFGGIDAPESEAKPPLTQLQFATAELQANAVVTALDELITPIGSLVIEAYDPERDWLKFETLAGLCNKLQKNQVFIFSARQSLFENVLARELVESGRLQLFSEPLSQLLSRLAEGGVIDLGPPRGDTGSGRTLRIAGKMVNLATDVWINVCRAGQPIDLSVFEQPPAVSPEKRYQEFRRFLMTSSGTPVWSAYANGFAFRRELADRLRKTIQPFLNVRGRSTSKPIVVHGSGGSGKTVMLGLLAYEIAKEGIFPAFFIPQHVKIPNREAVEQFCKWAEDNGASTTVVIWDGMREVNEYEDLISYLDGTRGRRVLLVGSAYRKNEKRFRRAAHFVRAEAQLTPAEKKSFCKFLAEITPNRIPHVLEEMVDRDDGHFLVALYRLVSETSSNLGSAVEQEALYWNSVESAFSETVKRLSAGQATNSPINLLAFAFDYAFRERRIPSGVDGEAFQARSQDVFTNDLVRFVMAPGQYGYYVPIELASRMLGRDGWQSISHTTEFSDLIEVISDPEGALTLKPRHREEARIFCRVAFNGLKEEVEIFTKLVQNAKVGSEMYYMGDKSSTLLRSSSRLSTMTRPEGSLNGSIARWRKLLKL